MATKKKKNELYFFKKAVNIPIYYGNFVIIFSNDSEKAKKIVNYHGDLCDFAFTFHNFSYNGKEAIAVLFNFWTEQPVTLGTIIHEVNHAGNRLMASRNIMPDYDNDESESYVKAWMAEEIEKFMKQCGII